MSTVYRGSAEAEAARRTLERRLAEDEPAPTTPRLTTAQLKDLCLESGADDVGLVEVDRAGSAPRPRSPSGCCPGPASVSYRHRRDAAESCAVEATDGAVARQRFDLERWDCRRPDDN